LDSSLGNLFQGPLFRRRWWDSEIPLCVLRSKVIHGSLIHLVRKKISEDEPDPVDPYEGVTVDNVVMVLAKDLNLRFPQLVIKYYESQLKWIRDGQSQASLEEKAARAMTARAIRMGEVKANETKLFNEMLPSRPTTGTEFDRAPGFTHFASARPKKKKKCSRDRFGLPESISSESDSADSSDSDKEIIKDWKTARLLTKQSRKSDSRLDDHDSGTEIGDTNCGSASEGSGSKGEDDIRDSAPIQVQDEIQ